MTIRRLFVAFAVFYVAIILFAAASSWSWPLRNTYLGGNVKAYTTAPQLWWRANFDGFHYLSIARVGYGYAQQAFFPLYPNLIRLFSLYLQPPVLAASVLSGVGFLAGWLLFYRLVRQDSTATIAWWSSIAILIFPTAFFFTVVYSEGIFFFFLIGAFYAARHQRWWLAGILGAAAAHTRLVGIFIFPSLIYEAWISLPSPRRLGWKWWRFIPLGFIVLGFLLYPLYLNRVTGDPLAFIHAQKLFGQGRSDKVVLLYQVYWRYFKMLFTVNRQDPLYLTILLETATAILVTAASFVSLTRHRISYALYNLAAFLLPTLTGSFTSMPRYALVCFPVFIVLGTWLSRVRAPLRLVLIVFSIATQVLFLTLFVRGYWVS